jgi:hypothetical protein
MDGTLEQLCSRARGGTKAGGEILSPRTLLHSSVHFAPSLIRWTFLFLIWFALYFLRPGSIRHVTKDNDQVMLLRQRRAGGPAHLCTEERQAGVQTNTDSSVVINNHAQPTEPPVSGHAFVCHASDSACVTSRAVAFCVSAALLRASEVIRVHKYR